MLAPLVGSDWDTSPAIGGFYFQASDGSVALPAAGYDYDIDWTPMSAGLAPAGMAASFAALAHQPAGYDMTTFWLVRFLMARGIECLVIDPGSLQINRRGRYN